MRDALKVCTCGRSYGVDEWRRLPRAGGVVDIELECPAQADEEALPAHELRTCLECGSTIAKEVPYAGGSDYPPPTSRTEERHGASARCGACGRLFSEDAWRRLQVVDTLGPEVIAHHVLRWPLAQSIEVRRCSACQGSVARKEQRGPLE